MKKHFLLALTALFALTASAKSVVFTLKDAKKTKVYYKITTDTPPRMIINDDGTFTVNGTPYALADVLGFEYSATDFSGEKNTVDGVASLQDDRLTLSGQVRIYDLQGRMLRTSENGVSLEGLPKGTYVITNGVSTIKMQKR